LIFRQAFGEMKGEVEGLLELGRRRKKGKALLDHLASKNTSLAFEGVRDFFVQMAKLEENERSDLESMKGLLSEGL
jgi:hypothetical protein